MLQEVAKEAIGEAEKSIFGLGQVSSGSLPLCCLAISNAHCLPQTSSWMVSTIACREAVKQLMLPPTPHSTASPLSWTASCAA